MKLTHAERLMLANQYRLLELIDAANADHHRYCRAVVENGYELEYGWMDEQVLSDDQSLSTEECREVAQILGMFDRMQWSYQQLVDKAGVETHYIEFPGFDANTEATRLGYCDHFCTGNSSRQRYKSLKRPADWNSHATMLPTYRRMLAVYEAKPGLGDLTKADLIEIVNAAAHPDSPIGQLRDVDAEGPVQ